jgi:hypothetical protein
MRYPLDSVTITQGYRANPNLFGYGAFGHTGIDLAAGIGTSLKAPVTGTVIGIGTNPSYAGGLYIIVRQTGGERWECYMGHLSKILVANGQAVTEGQHIGLTGQTGYATGPHVHFQVRHYGAGELVNPASLISNINVTGATSVDTIKSMYWRLLGREADAGGLTTYTAAAKTKGMEFVYLDLKNSAEGQADWVRRNPERVKALEDGIAQRDKAVAELRAALANEQAKPPKEVIKEVQVIVEKYVDRPVEVPVEVTPDWAKKIQAFVTAAVEFVKQIVKKEK